MMPAGRPKKYDENLTPVGLLLPNSMKESLFLESQGKNLSMNEYVISLVISSDKELAQNLAVHFKEMKEELQSKTNQLNELSREFSKFTQKRSNIGSFLFTEVEEDPETKEVMDSVVDGMKENFVVKARQDKVSALHAFTELGFSRFSERMLERNKLIKRPAWIKVLLKKKLLSVFGE